MVKTRENKMGGAYSTYEIMGNFLIVGTTVGFWRTTFLNL